MSTDGRKIIHCDCDCFFAAIEMRDNPALKGRPIAVGGTVAQRGVISTCNYQARTYGVRSAMPTALALKLCPGLLVLPHRFDQYRDVALQIREIFYDYSPSVEPLSLDEAFIDVTGIDRCFGSATLMAREIRRRVVEQTGITVSAGVAPNKFLAKVGSEWNKPDGLYVITPDQVDPFVSQLPVKYLYGVGRVTADKLHRMGVVVCGDLRAFNLFQLTEQFGRFGRRLYELSRGIDQRPVKTSRCRKSLSVEHTYAHDLNSVEECLQQLPALFGKFRQRLDTLDSTYAINQQFVKIKFNNFQTTTMECVSRGAARLSVFRELFCRLFQRGAGLPVRLLGIGVRFNNSSGQHPVQLTLFE